MNAGGHKQIVCRTFGRRESLALPSARARPVESDPENFLVHVENFRIASRA